jgi:hypothetical protein
MENVSFEEIRNILKENALAMVELRKSQAETEIQLAKTDAQLAKTNKVLSGIGFNLGTAAEEYFYYALEEKMRMGGIKYKEIEQNLKSKTKKLEDEFDIVMYNGNSIGIVEVKHKVHPTDIQKLISKKAENFRILFSDYKDYKIYLGIAGFSIPKEVEEEARTHGVAILRQKGDMLEMEDNNLKVY